MVTSIGKWALRAIAGAGLLLMSPAGLEAQAGICEYSGAGCRSDADCAGRCVHALTGCRADADCPGICAKSGAGCTQLSEERDCPLPGDSCQGDFCAGNDCRRHDWRLAASGGVTLDGLTDRAYFLERVGPDRSGPAFRLSRDRDAEETATAGFAFLAHLERPRLGPALWIPLSFGVGVGERSGFRLFLGTSVQIAERVFLTAGSALGETSRLPAGARVGEITADPNRISDLPRRNEASWFAGISYRFDVQEKKKDYVLLLDPPARLKVLSGGSVRKAVRATRVPGMAWPDQVELQATSDPAEDDLALSLRPAKGEPTFPAMVEIQTQAGTPSGLYKITVAGSAAGMADRSAQFFAKVYDSDEDGFFVTVDPPAVRKESLASVRVTVRRTGDYEGDVTVAIEPPAGVRVQPGSKSIRLDSTNPVRTFQLGVDAREASEAGPIRIAAVDPDGRDEEDLHIEP